MPSSHPENKSWLLKKIKQIKPKNILDVGAGEGTYGEFIKSFINSNIVIDAIEVWQPYIDYFNLKSIYDNVYQKDVRVYDNFDYDIVIFGDVLEHMSANDAIQLWNRCSKQAKYAIISIPITHMPQGAFNNNPYEIHVEEDWNSELVLEKFHSIIDYKLFQFTGAFIAKFTGN
jgi:hypothetical protein